jgi:hypothetical protein
MMRRWLAALLRGLTTLLGAIGVGIYTVGMVGTFPILMEGVTGLVGEGDHLRPESPEQIQNRLLVVGILVGTAVVGWVVARLWDIYREPGQPRPGVVRLAAEVFLFLGGLGLAMALLIRCAPRAGGHVTPDPYLLVGTVALFAAPVVLALGWLLLRYSPRPAPPEQAP